MGWVHTIGSIPGSWPFTLKLFTPAAVLKGQTQGRCHSGPPEPSFKKAQHSVPTLLPGIPVTHVDGYLPSVNRNNEHRNRADILGWSRLYEQEMVSLFEILFPQTVCPAIRFGNFPS